MKCATTTLHQDLSSHPEIFCGKKELNALLDDDPAKRYSQNYANPKSAPNDHPVVLGDVSTSYAMLPDNTGIAEKAHSIAGPNLKVIYLVREPISRTLSHHQHMMNDGTKKRMGADVNEAIRKHPSLISYSCYARQLEPWIEAFGLNQIMVVKFEDYVRGRNKTLKDIFEFLAVSKLEVEVDPEGANRGNDRRVAGSLIRKLYHTPLFQRVLQPLSPAFLKATIRRVFLKKSEVRSIAPTAATIDFIHDSVRADVEKLHAILGWEQPAWDFSNVLAKYK